MNVKPLPVEVSIPLRSDFNESKIGRPGYFTPVSIPLRSDFNFWKLEKSECTILSFNPSKV